MRTFGTSLTSLTSQVGPRNIRTAIAISIAVQFLLSGPARAQSRGYATNASVGSSVTVINAPSNAVVNGIAVGATALSVAFTPDGTRAYVANSGQSSLSLINVQTGKQLSLVRVGHGPVALGVKPDGSKVYSVNQNSQDVSVIDTQTQRLIATISLAESQPSDIEISPDG